MKKAKVVCDNDDFLVYLAYLYDQSEIGLLIALFTSRLARYLPCWRDIDAYLKSTHAQTFAAWGVRRGRLAVGFKMTWDKVKEWIKKHHGFDPEQRYPLTCARLRHYMDLIGDHPFAHCKETPYIKGAKKALRQLIAAGHEIYLLTCYDQSVFPGRYAALGLNQFFGDGMERVRAVEFRKTADDFKLLTGWTPENDKDFVWVAAGNSKSDILPALEISNRWHGFCVGFATTSVYVGGAEGNPEDPFTPAPINHPRVKNAKSILELPAYVAGLCAAESTPSS